MLTTLIASDWVIDSCGDGSKGERRYAWAWVATADPRCHLLIRRSLVPNDKGIRELAFYLVGSVAGTDASPPAWPGPAHPKDQEGALLDQLRGRTRRTDAIRAQGRVPGHEAAAAAFERWPVKRFPRPGSTSTAC